MRLMRILCFLLAAVAHSFALAHGPQIQITGDSGQIVTRRLLGDGPYSDALTAPTSVYVMPLKEDLGAWYSQPNGARNMDGTPEFFSGPGFAYGYGYDPLNPSVTPFTVGSKFNLRFADGLKKWNGATFFDAGATEIEAFTGGNPNAPSGVLSTSNTSPFAGLPIPGGAGTITFAVEEAEVHSTVRYRMLGDGVSPTSALPDGIYLASLQLLVTSNDKTPSDPFYFVLHKNAAADIAEAVESLNFAPNLVQFVVPEPGAVTLASAALALVASVGRRRKAAPRP
jgi:hypothetical protein